MEHFFDWLRRQQHPERPWLVLGKGPTFALRGRYDLRAYHLLSLNHAVREQPVLLAHMIDLDVVDACGDALLRQAAYVVLPWYPHTHNAPGARSLEELAAGHPLLRRLAGERRLLWYDLSSSPRRHGPGPVVQATYFSAEAALGLLALGGVRRVRSLGVDGGEAYSGEFADLHGSTLLANGQPSFDLQFQGIARTILRTGVDFAPLTVPSPIVVRRSDDPPTALPARVQEYSARKRSSMTMAVGHAVADHRDAGAPELRRAIVLAPRALVLDDFRKLWARPLEREGIEVPESTTGAAPAVAVVTAPDSPRLERLCRAALALLHAAPSGPHAEAATASLPERWSRPDRVDPGGTGVLDFAAAELQPWVSMAHPLAHLWMTELLEAVQTGFITTELVRSEVRLGHVRPSLLEQVELGVVESVLVPRSALQRDAAFAPPGRPRPVRGGLLTDPVLVLRALGRQARREVKAFRERRAARRQP